MVESVDNLRISSKRGSTAENQGPLEVAEDECCGSTSPSHPYIPEELDAREPTGYASLEGTYRGLKYGGKSKCTHMDKMTCAVKERGGAQRGTRKTREACKGDSAYKHFK